jgi:hypothetical protein
MSKRDDLSDRPRPSAHGGQIVAANTSGARKPAGGKSGGGFWDVLG